MASAFPWVITKSSETKGLVNMAGFRPIMHLLPEGTPSSILV